MPLITDVPEAASRHALVIGTATYALGWGDIGQGVMAEMAASKRLLLEHLGYQQKTFREILDPDSSLPKEVARWRAAINPGPGDWLLVYYTGHGIERGGMLHLITRDIGPDEGEAAPSAQNVVSALLGGNKIPGHVLLVLDTCHSASAHFDAAGLATRLRESKGGIARGADFHLIATTRSIAPAVVRHFTQALTDVITSGQAATSGDEFVQPSAAIEQVNQWLRKKGEQRASYSSSGEAALRFLPNPGWVPILRLDMEQEERRRVLYNIQSHALHAHWDPRARGVSNERDPGWFFTGRRAAMGHLIQWLTTGIGGLVVKGLPGSGKSAVLARLATLADPHQRDKALEAGALTGTSESEIPPPNVIDAAVHARAKDPARIALEIGSALDLELSGTDAEAATASALAIRQGRTVILIDALDEAQHPDNCAVFLRALLQRAANLCLVVGLRESGEQSGRLTTVLGPKFTPMDLDSAQWSEPQDLICYVERYLRSTPASPYADMASEPLFDFAKSIARRAGKSFLVASATAHALAAREMIVDAAELEPMPASVGEAFELDLKRFQGAAGEQLRQILTALACAEGRGLPVPEWLAIAKALSGGDVTAADIDRWSNDAGFYIVTDNEFRAPVRRLYHDEFAAYLSRDADPQREAAVAAALVGCVSGSAPEWTAASSYVLAFYPRHLWRAERTRELSELTCSAHWAKAKRERFEDPALILSDLDLAIDLARRAEPPDLQTIIRACKIHVRFATDTAPPIVIDILAGLGQLARAELMAEAIQFPLDRCQSFSFLAVRYANAGQHGRSLACVRAAEHAARSIGGAYHSLALYWVTRAARSAAQLETARRVRDALHLTLTELEAALVSDEASNPMLTADIRKEVAAKVWKTGDYVNTFAVEHWLFWAGMCLRELDDVDGLARIRAVLKACQPRGNNLALQTAAVVGDIEYLRALEPKDIVKPGNLALALMEANLVAEFDALRAAGKFEKYTHHDTAKRYAWALARRGDFAKALEVTAAIQKDPEEQARALFHVAETAWAVKNGEAMKRVVEAATKLNFMLTFEYGVITIAPSKGMRMSEADQLQLVQQHHLMALSRAGALVPGALDPAKPDVKQWRIQSWLAAVFLLAGENETAAAFAETICSFVIVPSEETSLALATPHTASSKGHVRLHSASDPDEGIREQVLRVAEMQGSTAARQFFKSQTASARSRAQILLELAHLELDSKCANELWLEALIASRSADSATLQAVLDQGETILARAGSNETAVYLRSQFRESQRSSVASESAML